MVIEELKVENISQTKKGIQVKLPGASTATWINADRSIGSFKDLNKGDVLTRVEMSDDNKWVKSYSVKTKAPAGSGTQSTNSPDKDARITRGNAVNAAFAAVYSAAMNDKKSHEEAFALAVDAADDLAHYISEGKANA